MYWLYSYLIIFIVLILIWVLFYYFYKKNNKIKNNEYEYKKVGLIDNKELKDEYSINENEVYKLIKGSIYKVDSARKYSTWYGGILPRIITLSRRRTMMTNESIFVKIDDVLFIFTNKKLLVKGSKINYSFLYGNIESIKELGKNKITMMIKSKSRNYQLEFKTLNDRNEFLNYFHTIKKTDFRKKEFKVSKEGDFKEKDIQSYVEYYSKKFFSIEYFITEFQLGLKDKRIDTLGLDVNNNICIIEYKKHKSNTQITQIFEYYKMLEENKNLINQFDKLNIPYDMKDSIAKNRKYRLICLSTEFGDSDIKLCKGLSKDKKISFELYKYTFDKGNFNIFNKLNLT